MTELKIKDIQLTNGDVLTLTIYSQRDDCLFEQADAIEYGESPYQLLEGKSYQYELSSANYQLVEQTIVTSNPTRNFSAGNINTGIYVGTIRIDIIDRAYDLLVGEVRLEVRSVKASYRDDYRQMLSDITDQCTELLMQHTSPAVQRFSIDPNDDAKTDYQRFAFVKSIIESDMFEEALMHIQQSLVKRWTTAENECHIENVKRMGSKELRQIARSSQRTLLPETHSLHGRISSVPSKLTVVSKRETEDIPENRFVKYVLQSFLSFCSSIQRNTNADERLTREARLACNKLNYFLSLPLFRNLSDVMVLPLNSPVLQRKEGYREVLEKWLMFDMASCLTWAGGEDVYEAGKKNVAVLYEYWLFFKLLDLFEKKFEIEALDKEKLISIDSGRLSLSLKQGRLRMLSGKYTNKSRVLNVRFFYNRTFGYSEKYEAKGSWTQNMRPDYTLSIWPDGVSEEIAEAQELITHIHFDAKYRIDHIRLKDKPYNQEEEISKELSSIKEEEETGTYKRADLLKMHAYKDAIKRTSGAYILYPGDENEVLEGYHEIIPGLGAFAISPKNYDASLKEFNSFIDNVIDNFLDRTSQRERMAYHTYETLLEPSSNIKLSLPETIGKNRNFVPAEINVIIGYCNPVNMEWLEENKLYNIPANGKEGCVPIGEDFVTAKYILLWNEEKAILYSLNQSGAGVYSERRFNEMGYSSTTLRNLMKKGFTREGAIKMIKFESIYYVFKFNDAEEIFGKYLWNTSEFTRKPHTIKLSELLKSAMEKKSFV